MFLRDFRESDARAVRDLIHHTIDVCYSPVYPPRAVQFFKDFHSEENILARHRKGQVLVAEEDGHLIGTGAIVECEVFGVFVRPECQRRGLGKALMQELERRAMMGGLAEIVLSVSLPSRRFYESMGYHMIEDCAINLGEGQQLSFWKAIKKLTRNDS